MDDIKLFDYPKSSASYRVRIGLNLTEIVYEKIPVNLLSGEHKSEDHKARNPQGFVPTLEVNGEMLTQSLAIIDYLNVTHGLRLLPEDPIKRAKVKALAYSLAVDVHPVCNLSVVNHAMELSGVGADGRAEWMRHFIRPGLLAFEALLTKLRSAPYSDENYAAGNQPGLAEICLMPQLYNADRWGAAYDDCPQILAIKALCDAHPAFINAHPDVE